MLVEEWGILNYCVLREGTFILLSGKEPEDFQKYIKQRNNISILIYCYKINEH
jgi:hypothetical protein